MNRRLLAAIAASAVMLAASLPVTAMAANPTRHIPAGTMGKIDPTFRPWMADSKHVVTAVLQLTDTAALAVPGLTKAQQHTRATSLRTSQGKLDAAIRAAGGRIQGRYQYAYNGIRVRASAARLASLAALPGVVAIRPLRTYKVDNTNAIPFIQAPTAWEASGATGAGETIAVIDTGIDYTHADFGGPGTPAAYKANDSTTLADGGFPTAKVIAGYDFAGNNYDADGTKGSPTPTPDPDPLDCGNHGSHVSGTAAGEGVKADHTTYTGPYDGSTLADPSKFVVGPGVAPEAKLVALKVFGCEGTTNLVVDALEWVGAYNATHGDAIDVVNMSLGAPFGSNTDPDAVATNNLVATGVVVVASAGNENNVPFITGAPAAATSAISVAALDAFPAIPLATITGAGATIPAINQNGFPGLPVSSKLHVLGNGAGGVKLGCSASDFDAASSGAIVAVKRGVCPFVDKGTFAAAAGAVGIVVINRDDTPAGDLPTYIGFNPELFGIPMIGTDKTAQAELIAAEGKTVTLNAAGTEANPTYKQIADFSSSGPRWGDSWLKPDLAAPGVNLLSALNGSGWNGTTYSGTSMAAPMTSGAAALVREAHPGWSPLKVKAALANTASADLVSGYDPLRSGAGVIQVDRAVATKVVATTSDRTASLNYGYEQADGGYSETKTITLWNSGNKDVTYDLAASSPLVSVWPSRVRVHAHDSANVMARASLSRAEVAALPSADQYLTQDFGALNSLSGVVTATPTRAGAFALRVPYLLVPRGLSNVGAETGRSSASGGTVTTSLRVDNWGVHDGAADVYALGITDPRGDGADGTDVRAVGIQVAPATMLGVNDPNDRTVQFAVNMWDRFSSASPHEIDIAVDTNNDGQPDRYIVGYDEGNAFTGVYDGVYLSLILDASNNLVDLWLADAPANGSTVLLPALASDLGLAPGSAPIAYQVAAIDGFTGIADLTSWANPFDVYAPPQTSGDFVLVPARSNTSIPASYQQGKGVRGWMVVSLDDRNGAAQADIVRIGYPGGDHGRDRAIIR
jgi:minor extracellular serine protease Vpr